MHLERGGRPEGALPKGKNGCKKTWIFLGFGVEDPPFGKATPRSSSRNRSKIKMIYTLFTFKTHIKAAKRKAFPLCVQRKQLVAKKRPCLAIRICESLRHPVHPCTLKTDATVVWVFWRVEWVESLLGCYSSTSSIRSEVVDYVTPALLVLILILNFLTPNPDPSICRLCLGTWQPVGNVR